MKFDAVREKLEGQFQNVQWIKGSGLDKDALMAQLELLEQQYKSATMIRAHGFALIAKKAQIAIDKDDIFQDKIDGYNLIKKFRIRWEKALKAARLPREAEEVTKAWSVYGTYHATSDYSHTSPNTRLLLQVGISGLRQRVIKAGEAEGLTEKQKEFYRACDIMLTAVSTVALRLATAIAPYNQRSSLALTQIALGRPRNTYEALQLLVLYFFLHDYVFGTRIRTLGRLDVLLAPFYEQDIAGGVAREEIGEMLKFFLHKFWAAKVAYDLPFCLCGMDEEGQEVTSEVTELILECYNSLNIYSPKIHIRVSPKTPAKVVMQVLSYIRGGNSSFVFVNDETAIRGLTRVGIAEKDARNYVPIGCYEPAVWGMELGCTGCGGINLAKAVELTFTGGRDAATGDVCSIETPFPQTYEAFVKTVKAHIAHLTDRATNYVTSIEPYYGTVNPDPLLSAQYDACVEKGMDIYDGGAKYNNSSMSFYSLASLVDSLCAVKALVFEEKKVTLPQLKEILLANWEGQTQLRNLALQLPHKFGINDTQADALAKELSAYCAGLINNRPNGRGGVYKAALYTIDHCIKTGKNTMATPDGRLAGTPLSKNLCAVTGMDKKGVTGLINSAGKLDGSLFPNGSVLDIVLHPSAVAGEEGLAAFYGIVMTYLKMGGLAIHGNVFRPEELRKAQQDPESYKNLQVRVCGWNAYFVNLTKEEQDAFILQAENAR
ncbi:MAG: hypothetical protein IKU07_08180 [Oscillospiraceae bacterium]|nr:hypothetical protein [Oscillospiraceae bacterium]